MPSDKQAPGRRGRRPSSPERYQQKAEATGDEDWRGWSFDELVSLACDYLAQRVPPSEIRRLMEKDHRIRIGRERPYHLIAYAAYSGRLVYLPPEEVALAYKLRARHNWLRTLVVAHTALAEDVSVRAASHLLSIIKEVRKAKQKADQPDEVHLGLSAGYTLGRTCHHLARMWASRDLDAMPRKVVFHTLVAGVSDDPGADPIGFCNYFASSPVLSARVEFVVLHAPAIVRTRGYRSLLKQPGIKDALEQKKSLDVIVTSLSDWRDDHSLVAKYLRKRDRDSYDAVTKANHFVGDMLGRPIGPDGPIPDSTFHIRALTLLDIEELPTFLGRSGKNRVVVLCGPCPKCSHSRARIVQAVLEYQSTTGRNDHLISDLVIDTRTGAELLTPGPTAEAR